MALQEARGPVAPSRSLFALLQYSFAALVALVVIVPLVAAVINGFKSTGELLLHPFGMPETWLWDNYTTILRSASFWRQMRNSVIVMVATALGWWCSRPCRRSCSRG